jgi:hypothetical protein
VTATLFKQVNYDLDSLAKFIELGQIGLPDIQRPFVWPNKKVRDLFDSMYRGYPVGYLLFWQNGFTADTKSIGNDHKQKVPDLLIVDGQQRLTSLYAVVKGEPVLRENYEKEKIAIAFNPLERMGTEAGILLSMGVIRASGAGRRLPDRRRRAAALRGHGGAHAGATARAARGDDRAADAAVRVPRRRGRRTGPHLGRGDSGARRGRRDGHGTGDGPSALQRLNQASTTYRMLNAWSNHPCLAPIAWRGGRGLPDLGAAGLRGDRRA